MQMNAIDEKYKDAIFHMGVTLDIVTLQLPVASNGFIGVSIYCDANGIAKEFKANTRATRLAQACGHNIVIYGRSRSTYLTLLPLNKNESCMLLR
jgi:hypothetical protein